jgi:hypothetical protein
MNIFEQLDKIDEYVKKRSNQNAADILFDTEEFGLGHMFSSPGNARPDKPAAPSASTGSEDTDSIEIHLDSDNAEK